MTITPETLHALNLALDTMISELAVAIDANAGRIEASTRDDGDLIVEVHYHEPDEDEGPQDTSCMWDAINRVIERHLPVTFADSGPLGGPFVANNHMWAGGEYARYELDEE